MESIPRCCVNSCLYCSSLLITPAGKSYWEVLCLPNATSHEPIDHGLEVSTQDHWTILPRGSPVDPQFDLYSMSHAPAQFAIFEKFSGWILLITFRFRRLKESVLSSIQVKVHSRLFHLHPGLLKGHQPSFFYHRLFEGH